MIHDETFPDDPLLNISDYESIQYSSLPSTSSTNLTGYKSSTDSSSAYSGDGYNKGYLRKGAFKNPSLSKKSLSTDSLLSRVPNKRFNHIQSKVKVYIDTMKEQDKNRGLGVKFKRHRSMPETLYMPQVDEIEDITVLRDELDQQKKIIQEKNSIIEEYKRFYESANQTLYEEMDEKFKLQKKIETMRMELMQQDIKKLPVPPSHSSLYINENSSTDVFGITKSTTSFGTASSSSPINDLQIGTTSPDNTDDTNFSIRKRLRNNPIDEYQIIQNTDEVDNILLQDMNNYQRKQLLPKKRKKSKKIRRLLKIIKCCAPCIAVDKNELQREALNDMQTSNLYNGLDGDFTQNDSANNFKYK